MAIHADGNLTIADGIFISANGGNGRADGIYDHGGGGSGGTRLVAKISSIRAWFRSRAEIEVPAEDASLWQPVVL